MSRVASGLGIGVEHATATRRQAVELARAYGREREAAGARVWQTPRVLPFETVLEASYALLGGDRPALLGDAAALRLWRRVIEASAVTPGLLDSRAAARAARRAYALAGAYDIDLSRVTQPTPDQAAFLAWAADYRAFLAAAGRVDRADLSAALRTAELPAGLLPLEIIDGEALPRGSEALLGHWQRLGRKVTRRSPRASVAAVRACVYPTREAEWAAIGDWLEACLTADPSARLAVLWPGLAEEAGTRRRQLDERLYPAGLVSGADPDRPYALACAPSLGASGVVATALEALCLADPVLDWVTLGRLLRSPYLEGSTSEGTARARVDARIRRQPARELTEAELERQLADAPGFAALRRRLQAVLAGPVRRPLDDWAIAFGTALEAIGWPGPRALGSDEHQTVVKFRAALGELAALAAVLPPGTGSQARAEFADIVAAMEFQAEAGAPQITVLDGPAALGFPVDGLWVAGLEAGRFPTRSPPEPLLPVALQRAAGVPGAEPRAGREAALRQLSDWRAWAGELVLSVAAFDGDVEQRPSPLLADFAPVRIREVAPRRDWLAQLAASRRVQPMPADALPPLPAGQPIRGGTGALGKQAACPFRAAFEARLGVEALESPGGGVGARLRGDLAHAALAELWRGLGSSSALQLLGAEERRQRVEVAVDGAFAALAVRLPSGRLTRIEREWQVEALERLLGADAGRPPFAVEAIEHELHLVLGDHPLRVKLDRLDRLADGATVLIDYKSGAHRRPAWEAERLADVQLPLYAVSLPEAPAAVVTAHLAPGDRTYAGVAASAGVVPHVGPPREAGQDGAGAYAALLAAWRVQIDGLALEFAGGRAVVAPTATACAYCPHELACRVVRDAADGEDEADGNAGGESGDE